MCVQDIIRVEPIEKLIERVKKEKAEWELNNPNKSWDKYLKQEQKKFEQRSANINSGIENY